MPKFMLSPALYHSVRQGTDTIYLSTYLSTYLSISVCLSVYLSIYLSSTIFCFSSDEEMHSFLEHHRRAMSVQRERESMARESVFRESVLRESVGRDSVHR